MTESATSSLTFKNGIKDGLPIGLGYLSTAFAFGVRASIMGVPVLIAVLISMTNLTSAGQLAGLNVIAALGSFLELAALQAVINSRYALMSLTLTQKADESFTFSKRLFFSAFVTDEIFAVAVSQDGQISAPYLYGLILLPFLGWSVGTLLGAAAGEILPKLLTDALGIALYGMFFAIFIPPMRKQKSIAFAVWMAAGCSILCKYGLPALSSGFAIILCGVLTAAVCAWLFPRTHAEQEGQS